MAITTHNKIELPPELLDELERMVMEEGMIISKACEEYASKIGATSSIVYSRFTGHPNYSEIKLVSLQNGTHNRSSGDEGGWDKTPFTNFWTLDEWKRRGLIKAKE